MPTLNDSDFYVVSATVIPVVFLAIVLEGGLWAWFTEKITSQGQDATFLVRMFISLLQAFGLLIVVAATISEILALGVLLEQKSSQITARIIFLSTAFLVGLLGAILAARIPGLWVVHQGELSLTLEGDEEIRWEGVCAKLGLTIFPWLWGKLFLTDRRLVWRAPRELGLFGAPPMEISTDSIAGLKDTQESFWFPLMRILPSNSLGVPLPPSGQFISVRIDAGSVYHLCVWRNGSEFLEASKPLIPQEANNDLGAVVDQSNAP